MGSTVRHARQDVRVGSLTLNFELLPIQNKRRRLCACPGPASCASGPSARVVDVEVQSLVAEQGVGVVKLEQVDALAGVVVAAGLHVSVAVPPVHRHDLPVATSKGAPGASLHIANGDRVCVSKTARCLGVTSETE